MSSQLLLRLQTAFIRLPNSCKYGFTQTCSCNFNIRRNRSTLLIFLITVFCKKKIRSLHLTHNRREEILKSVPQSELGQEEGTVQHQSNFPRAYLFLHLCKYSYGKDYSTMIQLPARTIFMIILLRKMKVWAIQDNVNHVSPGKALQL